VFFFFWFNMWGWRTVTKDGLGRDALLSLNQATLSLTSPDPIKRVNTSARLAELRKLMKAEQVDY